MKICVIGGIEIKTNIMLLICGILWIFTGLIDEAAVIMLVIFCHEAAHCIVARLLGAQVYSIELYPFGGAAQIDAEGYREWIIAVAGPLFSVFSAMTWLLLEQRGVVPHWKSFVDFSFMVAGVNMLPLFPLDGGRVLRGLVSLWVEQGRATRICCIFSITATCAIAVVGTINAIVNGAEYPLICLFLFFSAYKELKSVPYKRASALLNREHRRKSVMPVKEIAVNNEVSVIKTASHMTGDFFYVVRIVDETGEYCGEIDEVGVLDALFDGKMNAPVKEIIRKDR